jgi:hypothetical protein
MLLFVDQEKNIRIVKTHEEGGVTSRSPVGRLMKNKLELTDDLRAILSAEEIVEVEEVIAVYQRARSTRVEDYSLNFPVIVREVMDRFESNASNAERQLIMGALMDAVRRMRRYQRDGQQG